jgi:hypothetical protein
MTTYNEQVRNAGFRKEYLLLFFIVFVATFYLLNAVINTPLGRVMTGEHATDRHSEAEVDAIRKCLSVNGADMVWVKKDDPGVYVFCVNMDKSKACGKWGAVFAQFWPSLADQCDYRELTAFSPRDGTYHKLMDYLSNFARRVK